MRSAMIRRVAMLCAGVAALAAASPASAQAPPPSAEAAEIAACLCLGQAVAALNNDMTAQQRSHDAARADLAQLDVQLQSARAGINVNDPQAVARFRQLLEQRDAAFARSTSLATGELGSAIERYNARANEYNSRCANRPRDPNLLGRVQATLSCPPPY